MTTQQQQQIGSLIGSFKTVGLNKSAAQNWFKTFEVMAKQNGLSLQEINDYVKSNPQLSPYWNEAMSWSSLWNDMQSNWPKSLDERKAVWDNQAKGTKAAEEAKNQEAEWKSNFKSENSISDEDYNNWYNSLSKKGKSVVDYVSDRYHGDKYDNTWKKNVLSQVINDYDAYSPNKWAPKYFKQQEKKLSSLIDRYSNSYTDDYNNRLNTYLQARRNPTDTVQNSNAVEDATLHQGEAQVNANAMLTAGTNTANAGLLGSGNAVANTGNTTQATTNANKSNAASNQAAYLQNMANAKSLQQQADNMSKGAGWNVAGAALQGMGQGAATGASLGGGLSDERAKATPNATKENQEVDPKELNNLIRQFKSLYRQLQTLKGGK